MESDLRMWGGWGCGMKTDLLGMCNLSKEKKCFYFLDSEKMWCFNNVISRNHIFGNGGNQCSWFADMVCDLH